MPSVIFKSVDAPASAQIFGRIAKTTDLALAMRAVNQSNIANSDFDVSNIGATVKNGYFVSDGNGGFEATVLQDQHLDEFTIIGAVAIDINDTKKTTPFSFFLGGTFSTDQKGVGLRLHATNNASNTTMSLTLRLLTSGLDGNNASVLDQTRQTFVTDIPISDYPIHFYWARHQYVDGKSRMTVGVKSLNVTAGITLNSLHGATQRASNTESYQIGSAPNVSLDGTTHKLLTKEHLVYATALTDDEIETQYLATKNWLEKSGMDVSHWA